MKEPQTVEEFQKSECLKHDYKNHLKEGTTTWKGLLYEKGIINKL